METRVLPCDASSVSFEPLSSPLPPVIRSESTLSALQQATHALVTLGLPIAIPTETVYGLAANALSPEAVSRIFSTKNRPADNPLIIHVSSLPMLQSLLPHSFTIPPIYQSLIDAFWPGPLTLLFPASSIIPPIVTANHPTVAIRMPSHPIARALIQLSNTPLAAPSANSSGKPSPTKASHVLNDIGGKIPIILDGGPCDVGVESTVVDGMSTEGTVKVLRPGGLSVENIQRVLGAHVPVLVHKRDYEDSEIESAPTTPGMKYRHYAPGVPVILLMTAEPPAGVKKERLDSIVDDIISTLPGDQKPIVGLLSPSDSAITQSLTAGAPSSSIGRATIRHFSLGTLISPASAAHQLFDGLITLEGEGAHVILVEGVEETKEGLAVMNRVRKAAGEVKYVSM